MRRRAGFFVNAIAGSAAAILLLAAGMTFSVQRFEALTSAQIQHIRAVEHEITSAERLRGSGAILSSTGRGYLISGDPDLLARTQDAAADFDHEVPSLRRHARTPRGLELLAGVEQSARAYRDVQRQLLDARRRGSGQDLARRFEEELLPLRRQLDSSLDRLVDHKESVLDEIYRQAQRERDGVALRMYALLAALVVAGFVITWFFARQLVRAYAEEQVAHETARRALAARDEVMGMVAHDLRGPLAAIVMKAALLRKRADSAEARRHAMTIEDVAMRMEHLLRSMLDVATIEAGRFSVQPVACDADGMLHDTSEMFGSVASSKQIRLVAAPPSGLLVLADRERVIQVLSNLVSNALRLTPPGGEVRLSIERLGDRVRFAVSDSGPGIAREHLARVFDRFWKGEAAAGTTGTGLGLFIARGIVESHGGRIWAESELGHGATVSFTLPAARTRRAELPPNGRRARAG